MMTSQSDDRNWAGKVVAITGASAGVGRATAQRFARSGASLALLARDPASLDGTKAEMESAGARAVALPVDVANADAVFSAAERIEASLGPIDVWINDAMLTVFAPLHAMTADEFRRVTEATYLGFVHGTMAALRHMRARNRGIIIQIGSALAYRGIPLQSAYCGAKHAIRGFTDSVRAELLHENCGVKLVMVQLPAVNTLQFDWARTHMLYEPRPTPLVIQPEAAVHAIFQAARHPRREIWVVLSTAKVILGNLMVPEFLDIYLARRGFDGQSTGRSVPKSRGDNLLTPVPNLHRMRGSFSKEASTSAVRLTGPSIRLGIIILGLCLRWQQGLPRVRVCKFEPVFVVESARNRASSKDGEIF
jgi:short-subunit dehydrogenase